jgi:hypothetical protein
VRGDMLNSEINEKLETIKNILDELQSGLETNLKNEDWYSSQEFHEKSLKKIKAIKIIASL